ncbi:hypothetical protein MED01_000660 [Micromonospora sp. MED01]|uniref:hypothetical protein n=1 Tax=Micromonospora alfalfae TaxID=2911212 RepID=UPI001EE91B8E|nr:hypothetical protein [Micromonospora alfalfae]MCG5462556.1 hypothetical protein [Micromonospora alfalfae]
MSGSDPTTAPATGALPREVVLLTLPAMLQAVVRAVAREADRYEFQLTGVDAF